MKIIYKLMVGSLPVTIIVYSVLMNYRSTTDNIDRRGAEVLGRKKVPRMAVKDFLRHNTMMNGSSFAIVTKTNYPITATAPFIIENPGICAGNVSVLIIVHTATDHFKHRNIIRQTFGHVNLFSHGYSVRTVFLLGLTDNEETQKGIWDENGKHHDIVQGEFIDSYRNLTLKGVMAYRWITLHCMNAKLVLKIDDDVFVNIFTILEDYVPAMQGNDTTLRCKILGGNKIVRHSSKWQVDEDFFRGVKRYSQYCGGFVVLIPTKIIPSLFHAAKITPFFWVDDYYLYGLLPAANKVSRTNLRNELSYRTQECVEWMGNKRRRVVGCICRPLDTCIRLWGLNMKSIGSSILPFLNQTFVTKSNKLIV